MTIVLDVSFSDQQSSCDSAINEISRKKVKDKSNSSKAIKVAKVKHKVIYFFSLHYESKVEKHELQLQRE